MKNESSRERAARAETREVKIERLFGECMDAMNRGETVDRERILADHPDVGAEVLLEVETFQEIGLGNKGGRNGSGGGDLGALGEFRLLRQVGRGGMGVVYEAWQTSMDRRVALKVLREGIPRDQKSVLRFLREARVAGKLQHPGIVPVFGTGVEDRTPYYAMEFVEGETLEEILSRLRAGAGIESSEGIQKVLSKLTGSFRRARSGEESETAAPGPGTAADAGDRGPRGQDTARAGALPASPFHTEEINLEYCHRVARAFAGVAQALQHAHAKGVIHRDLKPSNLILDREGRLRILDFGLAHLEGQRSLTLSGEFLGTPIYMSPEQAMAHRVPVDYRTDLYSLGVTLYEMLTWRTPFRGRDYKDTLSQIIAKDPPPPRRINPRIPRELETVVLKCLRKDPDERYGTAEALGQDLERLVRGDPIEARPQSFLERALRRLWRQKVKTAIAAGVAALVLLTGFLLWKSHRDHLREIETGYEPRVLAALEKLQAGKVFFDPAMWSRSRFDPEGVFVERMGVEKLLGDEVYQPVREGLEELRRAAESLPGRCDARYHLARGGLILGQREEALTDLDEALRQDPGFAPARVLKAAILDRQGDPGGARREMDLAAKSGGHAWVEAWLRAHRAMEENRWPDAVEAYDRLIALEENGGRTYLGSSLDHLLARARARLEAGDLHGAIEDCVRAEDRWPEWMEPVLLKGRAYLLLGKPETAEKVFRALHARSGRKDAVAMGVIDIYFYLFEDEKALEWSKTITNEVLRDVKRGMCLNDLGRFEEAIQNGQEILRRHPDDLQARMQLYHAHVHGGKGNFAEAERVSRELVALSPGVSYFHVVLADSLLFQGKPQAALAECDLALALDHRSSLARTIRGAALRAQGRDDQALKELEEARRIDPFNPDVLLHLGRFYSDTGKLDEAIAVLDQGARLAPRSSPLLAKWGETFERKGLLDRAVEAYSQAARGFPLEAHAFLGLASISSKQGKFQEAIAQLARAFEVNPDQARGSSLTREIIDRIDFAQLGDGAEGAVGMLERALKPGEEDPVFLGAIAFALSRPSKIRDVGKALRYARLAVERTKGLDLQVVLTLAQVQFGSGDRAGAILTLEEGLRAQGGWRAPPRLLDEYRRAVLPDLPSCSSIDAALARAGTEEIVPEGAAWRFFRGKREPSGALDLKWTEPGFKEDGWEAGKSGFGYGDGDDATVLDDMQRNYSAVYLRADFEVPEPGRYPSYTLTVTADDGFVAYLNGCEVARERAGKPGAPIPHDAQADFTAPEPLGARDFPIDRKLVRRGRNLLALQGINRSDSSTDFSLIPVFRGVLPSDPDRDRTALGEFRAAARGEGSAGLIAYLEGRVFQFAGRHRAAAERLSEALGLEARRSGGLPLLRLVESLRAAGDAGTAALKLFEGLKGAAADRREIWDLWVSTSLVDLKQKPEEILAALTEARIKDGYAADLRWLKEQIAAGAPIRINCGGDEYPSPTGVSWGRDRFFVSGVRYNETANSRRVLDPQPYSGEIRGTADALLYQTERWYPGFEERSPGYRIPFLSGRLRLKLHFAEIAYQEPGRRVFDVLVEGRPVLDAFEPCQAGFATARVEIVETTVEDGILDIEFVRRAGEPKISAIEVERVK